MLGATALGGGNSFATTYVRQRSDKLIAALLFPRGRTAGILAPRRGRNFPSPGWIPLMP